jgi:hypothetical protein
VNGSPGTGFLAAGDGVSIGPGGCFLIADPSLAGLGTVTPGTGDLITVTNAAGGTGVDYEIMIVGTNA